jgi:uncharacterized protein
MKTHKNLILKSAVVALAAIFILTLFSNTVNAQEKSVLNGKKILFVWGGWAGHDPDKCRDIFVPWLESEGAIVTVSNTLDSYVNMNLKELDLIIQVWTMGTITGAQERALEAAVKSGVGMAGWHGGMGDSFRNNTEYEFMVGGSWVAHPGGVIDYRVNITDHNDPVTKGLTDFDMHSEQYYVLVDPNNKVLATTTYTDKIASWIGGNIIPQVWKKVYGKGRIFYSGLGHVAADFSVPQVLEIQKRGIRWAVMSKYEQTESLRQSVYPGPTK